MISHILTRKTREWNKVRIDELVSDLASQTLGLSLFGSQYSYIWPLQKAGISVQTAKTQSTITLLNNDNWNWNKCLYGHFFLFWILNASCEKCDTMLFQTETICRFKAYSSTWLIPNVESRSLFPIFTSTANSQKSLKTWAMESIPGFTL